MITQAEIQLLIPNTREHRCCPLCKIESVLRLSTHDGKIPGLPIGEDPEKLTTMMRTAALEVIELICQTCGYVRLVSITTLKRLSEQKISEGQA